LAEELVHFVAGSGQGGEAFDDDCVFCDGGVSLGVVVAGFDHLVADVNEHEELQQEGARTQGGL
jgi:hypothetical protein